MSNIPELPTTGGRFLRDASGKPLPLADEPSDATAAPAAPPTTKTTEK